MSRIARRLAQLEVLARPSPPSSESEREIVAQLTHAICCPSACARPDAEEQYRYLLRTIAAHARLPPTVIARALVAALVACGADADEARDAVMANGVAAVLRAWAEQAVAVAEAQIEQRERDAAASAETQRRRKAAARAAYFAQRPRATEHDFEVAWWPKWSWRWEPGDAVRVDAS